MITSVGLDLICNLLANTGTSASQLAYIALSSDATTPTVDDVMPLTGEFARQAATVAYTTGTGQLSFTITYTASGSVTMNKAALTDNATPGSGVLAFVGLNPGPLALNSGDVTGQTITVTFS